MSWPIQYYEQPDGSCPFEEWLYGLDPAIQHYILSTLDRMSESENLGDCRSIEIENASA